MSGNDSDTTRKIDSLQQNYQKVFEELAIEKIAGMEQAWTEAAAKNPNFKPYFDLELSELHRLRVHVPGIAREAAGFLREIDQAQYKEEIEDLDSSLSRRELNFGKILTGAVLENYRLARLERARGRVRDIQAALSTDLILQSCLTVSQLAGKEGYLTNSPNLTRLHNWSSQISNDLARSIRNAFRQPERKVLRHLVRFFPRYLLDLARRNFFRLIVIIVVFGWFVGLFIEYDPISVLTLAGVILVMFSTLGPMAFERIFKRKWLETHRLTVRSAATHLYISLLYFIPERASLQVMHKLSDEENMLKLSAKMPPGPSEAAELSVENDEASPTGA